MTAARFIIAGAGAFGRELAEWIGLRQKVSPTTIEFIDDVQPAGRRLADRWLVRCSIQEYRPESQHRVFVSIAEPAERKKVAEFLQGRGCRMSSAAWEIVAASARHRTGNGGAGYCTGLIMAPGSVISAGARVGSFVHLNLYALVGHDAVIGDYCTLSSGVDICGGAELGEGVFVGSGARVLPGVKVGAHARIHAGSVVARCVDAGKTVFGNPARVIS